MYYYSIMVTMLLFQVCIPTQIIVLSNGLNMQQAKYLLVQTTTMNFYHITLFDQTVEILPTFIHIPFLLILMRVSYFFIFPLYETDIYFIYPAQFLSHKAKNLQI